MEDKAVLISYQDSKKVVKISYTDDADSMTEVFWREFDLESSHTDLKVVFQRFDPEWEEYIDLPPGAAIVHKEKLKAVTLPIHIAKNPSKPDSAVSLKYIL